MASEILRREQTEKSTPAPPLEQGMHPSFLNVLIQKKSIKEKTAGIKHRIGVYSAKGGVGKTTVAVNLAYALSEMGFSIGLLDADIDCPNVTFFMGIDTVISQDYPLKPVVKDGIKVMSTALFTQDKEKPIMWRGPMKGKMLREFFENTSWGDLDYIIIDLPPGTSDTPLSLMQLLDLDGILLVTTPQSIAAKNTIRSGYMAKRMNIHLFGVVETMSGEGPAGALHVAKVLDTDLLGTIKYDEKFNKYSDSGKVPFLMEKQIHDTFESIAKKLSYLGKKTST